MKINRRTAIKATTLAAAAAALPGCLREGASSGEAPGAESLGIVGPDGERVLPWSNWSGNQQCQPSGRVAPRDEAELSDVLKRSEKVRFVGSSHSFSALVPTEHTLVAMAGLRGVESVDEKTGEALIRGGTRLAQIGEPLWERGRGLINMPDIDVQTLAGAIATSTHGTGMSLGSMSSEVTQLRLVTAQGDVLECSRQRNTDVFHAARTSLGTLGAVSRVGLRTRPAYSLHERSWMMPLEEGLERAPELRDKHRHFELYALPHADYIFGITLDETGEPDTAPAANSSEDAFRTVAKITKVLPFLRSTIMNIGARQVEPEERRGRSYRIFANIRNTRFNEMEYTVPAEQGTACLAEILRAIRKLDLDVIFPIEFRYVQADDIWLSPFYQRPGCSISCHNFHDRDYREYFAAIEPIFWMHEGRPHPGKIHTLQASQLARLYPRWNDFLRVRAELDPQGKFLNEHLQRVLGIRAA